MSVDRVPGDAELYLGGFITLKRYAALKKANITHVLSVLAGPVNPELLEPYTHLAIEVNDTEDENLLEHFPVSNAFIQEGLDGGDGVLVHCAAGKSRSVTLVIAYLLSMSTSLSTTTPQSLLNLVRQVRPFAEPNPGFMQQLELYHCMSCPKYPDSHPLYQRWRHDQDVARNVACGQSPDMILFADELVSRATIDESGGKQKEENENPKEGKEMEYRCRKCRCSLATSIYLIPHVPKSKHESDPSSSPLHHDGYESGVLFSSSSQTLSSPQKCAHIFLEPLSWMRSELEQGRLEGRLECPNSKCRTNVGKYAWQGMRCNCGEWVVPGLGLARGKVDELKKAKSGGGKI